MRYSYTLPAEKWQADKSVCRQYNVDTSRTGDLARHLPLESSTKEVHYSSSSTAKRPHLTSQWRTEDSYQDQHVAAVH
jgi:hypothetical protein